MVAAISFGFAMTVKKIIVVLEQSTITGFAVLCQTKNCFSNFTEILVELDA